MYADLIMGGHKDHLGVSREGVWAVSLCVAYVGLRIAFSENTTCDKVLKGRKIYFIVPLMQFTVTSKFLYFTLHTF